MAFTPPPSTNMRLSYSYQGSKVLQARCVQLSNSYGVNAEESHARTNRAFYPHQRVQGTFGVGLAFIGWKDYEIGMKWFRNYFRAVLTNRQPSPMLVQCAPRGFARLGMPTTGVAFGDHVGSMVFAPMISFISMADPSDPHSGISSLNRDSSRADLKPGGELEVQWFYPDSRLNHPGNLYEYMYDRAIEAAAAALEQIQQALYGPPPPPLQVGRPGLTGGIGIE